MISKQLGVETSGCLRILPQKSISIS